MKKVVYLVPFLGLGLIFHVSAQDADMRQKTLEAIERRRLAAQQAMQQPPIQQLPKEQVEISPEEAREIKERRATFAEAAQSRTQPARIESALEESSIAYEPFINVEMTQPRQFAPNLPSTPASVTLTPAEPVSVPTTYTEESVTEEAYPESEITSPVIATTTESLAEPVTTKSVGSEVTKPAWSWWNAIKEATEKYLPTLYQTGSEKAREAATGLSEYAQRTGEFAKRASQAVQKKYTELREEYERPRREQAAKAAAQKALYQQVAMKPIIEKNARNMFNYFQPWAYTMIQLKNIGKEDKDQVDKFAYSFKTELILPELKGQQEYNKKTFDFNLNKTSTKGLYALTAQQFKLPYEEEAKGRTATAYEYLTSLLQPAKQEETTQAKLQRLADIKRSTDTMFKAFTPWAYSMLKLTEQDAFQYKFLSTQSLTPIRDTQGFDGKVYEIYLNKEKVPNLYTLGIRLPESE